MGNRLAQSSSPYLLQHADNPVDWHEWGEEPLALACAQDKPILLSIGYSACHWCHVMAHESFEDAETAALMNRLCINIKVDREQRPDLDRIYQAAHQVMNRRGGGWPLTVFLDPHTQLPFFIGTYFPKQSRHGLPDFGTVLARVAEWYASERDAREKHGQAMREVFERLQPPAPSGEVAFDARVMVHALESLERGFDPRWGGFSPAPKFPHPGHLRLLLGREGPRPLHMAHHTLKRMCLGGLFDQLGGGWYRYSVDARWEIPHFEKMLYDNGLLLGCATGCWGRTHDRVLERAIRLTADWALREMQHPDGGFFSSLDADSEGEEGRFYTWDAAVVREALDDDEWRVAAWAWGLERPPNFEGRWHLHGQEEPDEAASRDALERARVRLFAERGKRVRPGLDDKMLAGWNGLMIGGLAEAGHAFNEDRWIDAAARAADFIRSKLWRDERLCVSWRNDVVVPMAFLDDYAYLLDGLLALMQAKFRREDLVFAMALADGLLSRFADHAHGGFHFTADDHESLVQRPKSFADDATPNGNGVAALALQRLGHLVGETRYLDAAADTLKAAWPSLVDSPHAHAAVLTALDEHLEPPELRIIRAEGAELDTWARTPGSRPHYRPRQLEFRIPIDLDDLPGQLAHQELIDGKPALYRCIGTRCEAPVPLDA